MVHYKPKSAQLNSKVPLQSIFSHTLSYSTVKHPITRGMRAMLYTTSPFLVLLLIKFILYILWYNYQVSLPLASLRHYLVLYTLATPSSQISYLHYILKAIPIYTHFLVLRVWSCNLLHQESISQIIINCINLSCIVLIYLTSHYIFPITHYNSIHNIKLPSSTSIFKQLLLHWYYNQFTVQQVQVPAQTTI